MAVTLVIQSDDEPSILSFDQPRVVLGRGDSCDFRIPEPSVSHRHASIRQRGSEYVVVDEGSLNGSFLGSMRLHPQSPVVLAHGSMVRVGRVWIEVRLESVMPTVQPVQATRDLALAMVSRVLASEGVDGTPRLVAVEGPDAGREVDLSETGRAVTLGRGRDVEFPLTVEDASRRHVRVVRRGGVALVRDLGSRNGTRLGGRLVAVDRDDVLQPGDHFSIGADVFVFENPVVEVLRQIEAAEDEAMREDEPIADPPVPTVVASARSADRLSDRPSLSSVERPSQHPSERSSSERRADSEEDPDGVSSRPRNKRRVRKKKSAGWGKADFVVVLLALAVLALSVVGLVWLFRGV